MSVPTSMKNGMAMTEKLSAEVTRDCASMLIISMPGKKAVNTVIEAIEMLRAMGTDRNIRAKRVINSVAIICPRPLLRHIR